MTEMFTAFLLIVALWLGLRVLFALPYGFAVKHPLRFSMGCMLYLLGWLVTVVRTKGFLKVFFGRSLSSDQHNRPHQLPYGVKVAYRFLYWLQYLFGGDRFFFLEKRLNTRALIHCQQHFPKPDECVMELPRIRADDLDPETFFKTYVKNPHPVLLEGFAESTFAKNNWNIDYFYKYGEDVAPVASIKGGYETAEKIKLSAYLDYMQEVLSHPERKADTEYVRNFTNLFHDHPELVEQLEVNRVMDLIEPYALHVKHAASNLFIGVNDLQKSGSPWHCADAFNFFFMVQGEKEWEFAHPDYSPMLYPMITKHAQAVLSLITFLDLDSEYMEKDFPLFKYCPRYRCIVKPGDVLLNPPFYWHRVKNLTPTSIGVSTRWLLVPKRVCNELFHFFAINNISRMMLILPGIMQEGGVTDEQLIDMKDREQATRLFEKCARIKRPSEGAMSHTV